MNLAKTDWIFKERLNNAVGGAEMAA